MPYAPAYASGGSANGKLVKVVATTTPGTTLHVTNAGVMSEITIQATNNHTGIVTLTIEWGGTLNPDDRIVKDIPPKDGFVLVVTRPARLGPALTVAAFASVTNVVSCLITVDEYTAA